MKAYKGDAPYLYIRGIYRDRLYHPDGTLAFDSGWNSNTIVDTCRVLIARFMANDNEIVQAHAQSTNSGLQYMRVGSGEESWDEEDGPPKVDPSWDKGLINQYETKISDLRIEYLNDKGIPEVGIQTAALQISVRLAAGFPKPEQSKTTYPLREFGLYGAYRGQEYMINCVRHPVIHKNSNATLERVVNLYFAAPPETEN